jgi:hypothetical protein
VLVELKRAEPLGSSLAFEEFSSTRVLVLVDLARREAPIKDLPGLVVVVWLLKMMTRTMMVVTIMTGSIMTGSMMTGSVMREGVLAMAVATVGGRKSEEHDAHDQQNQQE